MTTFMVFITTVIVIALMRILIQVFKFFKFFTDINKLPGPARYPLPTVSLQIKKIKHEGKQN